MEAAPIRILHVIGILNRGGAETMIMNLYRNIDRCKIQFDFVQNEGPEAVFEKEINLLGGRIYRCPRYRGKNHFAYIKWWNDFFQEHQGEYPVVHGHIGSTASIYLSIAKKYGAYAITHSHSAGEGSAAYRILSYPTRYIAERFFACSVDAAKNRYGIRVSEDKSKCRILNNAVDTKRFSFSSVIRHEIRSQFKIARNALVIGHVGRFAPVKNHLFLLDVFEQIHRYVPDAVLLLVGDGELRTQIEAEILRKQLNENVVLTGVRNDVSNCYQAMDVLVFPSLFEGVPVSLVEAQAAGLPCCVSAGVPRDAAITELVQFKSLNESAEQWAQWVLERAKIPRKDMSEEMKKAGYDISETAQWLQEFYLEVVRSHEREN